MAVAHLFLVRPMKTPLAFSAPLLLAAIISSCISTEMKYPFEFPFVYTDGRYAGQWTLDDFRQIRQLIREYPQIRKPLDSVDVFAPDRAHVSSGSPWLDPEQVGTTFDVQKKNGRWFIIKGSINTSHEIITS